MPTVPQSTIQAVRSFALWTDIHAADEAHHTETVARATGDHCAHVAAMHARNLATSRRAMRDARERMAMRGIVW